MHALSYIGHNGGGAGGESAVRPSHAGIASKRLNVSSNFFQAV